MTCLNHSKANFFKNCSKNAWNNGKSFLSFTPDQKISLHFPIWRLDFEFAIFLTLLQTLFYFLSKQTEMAGAVVGGAFLSASLQVLFDRLASREVINFIRGHNLSDELLKKMKLFDARWKPTPRQVRYGALCPPCLIPHLVIKV